MEAKKLKKVIAMLVVAIALVSIVSLSGCTDTKEVESDTGVGKASAVLEPGPDGLTNEQRNVQRRLEEENSYGNLQWLYCISTYSGQIIYMSSVDGKVTSSGKRLTPTILGASGDWSDTWMRVNIGDESYRTQEVIQDDGTYGSSEPYIFWYDMNGNYHQQFMTGGVMVHISDYPIQVNDVILNIDALGENSTGWS